MGLAPEEKVKYLEELMSRGERLSTEEMGLYKSLTGMTLPDKPLQGVPQIETTARGEEAPIAVGFGESLRKGTPSWLLPAAAGVAALAIPETAPVTGRMAIEGLLGAGAEGLNQFFGVTDRDSTQIGLSAGAPVAGRGLAMSTKLLPKNLSESVQKVGAESVKGKVMAKAPSKAEVDAAFNALEEGGELIPLPKTVKTVRDELVRLYEKSDLARPSQELLSGMADFLKKIENNALTPRQLQNELEGIGERLGSTKKQGTMGYNAVEKVYATVMEELGEIPAAAGLLRAREYYLKRATAREIGDLVDEGVQIMRGQGFGTKFDSVGVIKKLQKNKFYSKAYTEGEREDIEATLKTLNYLPPASNSLVRGVQSLATMGGMGGVGAALGQTMGNPTMTAGAMTAAGAALPTVLDVGRTVATAIQLKTGRALIRELADQNKGRMTPNAMSILGAFTRAYATDPDSEMFQ